MKKEARISENTRKKNAKRKDEPNSTRTLTRLLARVLYMDAGGHFFYREKKYVR